MIAFKIRQEPIIGLEELSRIRMAFEVKSLFEARRSDTGEIELCERWLEAPYLKDYDAIPGNRPIDLPRHFDLSNWCLLSARYDQRWIGGALIAWKTTGVDLLENRDDLAVLWDLRVNPADRRRGVASALFEQAVSWAQSRGCRALKIESQNNNVPACRFYSSRGCRLRDVLSGVYADFPEEIQFLWYKDFA
ncbi:GNAT family N-acetyltransferase [Schlesneria paludicola]|uniref:GNAT family N-acetyltransferase n=1 Tax=Schlesneria paludicola TaxID=360056 RepID=UPI00029A0B12|nr:GNAT family N-acetyltransferase [Schlesneria paludicola]